MFRVTLVLLAIVTGCTHRATTPATRGPEVVLAAPGREVHVRVEVARTLEQRRTGLMNRDRLDPDAGMLFLFERPERQSFWMHNTYLPLDMIFIAPDRTIVGIVERAEPLTDSPRAVEGESLYVLEVNGGFAAAHQIFPHSQVQFVSIPAMEGP